jgi:SPP1 gp7 family putative phage head morphogenesis protein
LKLSKDREDEIRKELSSLFDGMMQTLYSLKGSEFRIEVLAKPKVQEFIDAHAAVLDSGFKQVEMSEAMRRRLTRSDYIFSGMKTFHELNEAFPSLLDENGNRKPFERFLNDVRKIDSTYNSNYLRAEYNFVQSSAEMAAKWEKFMEDGDRYYLQYRTAKDDKVRPEHAALHGVTLPITDPFWEEYYPPNGWNCRCTVVQVRKSKYPATPHDEAMVLGEEALQRDSKGIFHFNAGKEQKTVPDYNPYTIRRCRDCDVAKGKLKLAFVPDNELCSACAILQKCAGDRTKTQRAIERTHYLHEMEPLLGKSVTKTARDKNLNIGFTKYGNSHLFSDTFGRSRILSKDDLKDLGNILDAASYIDDSPLTHPRTDGIEHFYYFKAQIRGQWVRLNVAKQVYQRPSGQIERRYFMYSINDI